MKLTEVAEIAGISEESTRDIPPDILGYEGIVSKVVAALADFGPKTATSNRTGTSRIKVGSYSACALFARLGSFETSTSFPNLKNSLLRKIWISSKVIAATNGCFTDLNENVYKEEIPAPNFVAK